MRRSDFSIVGNDGSRFHNYFGYLHGAQRLKTRIESFSSVIYSVKQCRGSEFEILAYDGRPYEAWKGRQADHTTVVLLPNLHGIEWELERLRPEYYGAAAKRSKSKNRRRFRVTGYRERDRRKYPSCWQAPFATCGRAGWA